MRLCFLVFALAITVTAQHNTKNEFKPNGNPFNNFGTANLPFDSNCTSQSGDAKSNTGSFAQDVVKNNFSASEPAKNITVIELVSLESEIAKNKDYQSWGSGKEPLSRDAFHNLKAGFDEGQMVTLTAYIFEAHAADTDSGETVNCQFGTKSTHNPVTNATLAASDNDVHIALVVAPSETNECQSVTAEVSPHFRPAPWAATAFNGRLKGKLVRLTGQLMYDASHKPCAASGQQPPKRQSSWEIHPVYQVEVCPKDDGKGTCTSEFESVSQFAGKPAPAGSSKGKNAKKNKSTAAGSSAPPQ